ncbi:MAG TPA: PepSY-like domain-containing protein [Chitinophagaceae bacterium]|nr:PepSY-like domain-containing protein [Chitinophagaceae bacterium]
MITRLKSVKAFYFLALAVTGFTACKKENSTTTGNSASVSSSPVIAVGIGGSGTTSGDSIYILQPCERGSHRDSIAAADLPAGITSYLTSNYSAYTFNKAFTVKNSAGIITAYVVIINYNDKPVALLFDSSSNFIKVLEQRDKSDLDGPGWHEGGRFCDRDGLQKDTVALNALLSDIINYMNANYPQDTLLNAFKSRNDSSYVIISKDNGLFATVFDAIGNFVKRVTLPTQSGICIRIVQSTLPPNVLSYLTTTYPNYIFNKAFAVHLNSVLQGYIIIINANNTKYAVRFDASGNFVSVKTLW